MEQDRESWGVCVCVCLGSIGWGVGRDSGESSRCLRNPFAFPEPMQMA